jgi:hypothetical protein
VTIKWLWTNGTQVDFSIDAITKHFPKFVKSRSKKPYRLGGGSIDKNGARSAVQTAFEAFD